MLQVVDFCMAILLIAIIVKALMLMFKIKD